MMSENPVIRVEKLNKTIRGHHILKDIDLIVEPGEVCGVVGQNGSGKSMLFKALCGLILPSAGDIWVFGKSIGKSGAFPEDTGTLIESPGFLSQYSGLKNLKLLASLQRKIGEAEIRKALERVGLDPEDRRPVRKYSMGMRQKLGIAQAFMERPRLMILDEPMNNLDAGSVEDMRGMLADLNREEGVTILLSSHNDLDIKTLCTRIHSMKAGVLSDLQGGEEADHAPV